MIRRFLVAMAMAVLACGWSAAPARAEQSPLADAQHDYNAGRYNRAVDTLNAAIAKSPNDSTLYFLLGQSYYQLHEFARAAASLETAVQFSPKNSEYHDWLGKSYGRRAEQSMFLSAMSWARKTHREFEIAAELDPRNFEAQRDLIRYEMNAPAIVNGGDDKALKHIDELEKIDSIQGQLARGEFLATKRRAGEADAVFGKILESSADRAGVFFEVGEYFRGRQNAEKTREAIEKAERIDPADRRLKFYRGVVLVMKGENSGEAEMLLESYIAAVPDNADLPPHAAAREWLGKLYESLGRSSEAAEQYRLSLTLDPHNKAVEEDWKRVQRK